MKYLIMMIALSYSLTLEAQKTFDALPNTGLSIGSVMDMKEDGICEIYMVQNFTNNNGPYLRCYYRPLGSFVSTTNYALNTNVNMNGVQRIVYSQPFTQNGVNYYKYYCRPVIIRGNPSVLNPNRVNKVNYANRVTAWNEYNGFTYGGQPRYNQQVGGVRNPLIWALGGLIIGRILR